MPSGVYGAGLELMHNMYTHYLLVKNFNAYLFPDVFNSKNVNPSDSVAQSDERRTVASYRCFSRSFFGNHRLFYEYFIISAYSLLSDRFYPDLVLPVHDQSI